MKTTAKSTHIIADFKRCRAEKVFFTDAKEMLPFIHLLIEDSGMKIMGEVKKSFGEGQGFTLLFIVSESHVAIHTWAEKALVNVDIYYCAYTHSNKAKAHRLLAGLKQIYKPTKVEKKEIERE